MSKRTRRLGSFRNWRKLSHQHLQRRHSRSPRIEQLEPRLVLSHDSNTAYLFAMPADLQEQANAHAAAAGLLNASPFPDITWSTLANGMPILDSYPSAPAAIFLDFDGDTGSGTQAYDIDGSPTTFNPAEQANIVETWRHMSLYFAMFNVKITTIQPNVGTMPTAWIAIGNNIQGAYSGVNVFANTSPQAFQTSDDIIGRISATAHEIGHNFGSWHIAGYDNLGNKIAEYHDAFDPLHGPLMGLDYTGVIHKWSAWHDSTDVATLQDDMARIAADLNAVDGSGDGYKPDDYSGAIATATPLTTVGNTQARVGIIERLTDSDAFSFTSTGGRYSILVGRDAPSGVDVKVSVYKSDGTLLATEDGDPRKVPYTMVNDSHLTLDLPAGTYYIVVQSHGNYADQGQYIVRVDPLSAGWTSEAVGLVGVPGYSSYNAATGTYTVAGSGHDIWGSSDAFQFLHQSLTGDGSITVRVNSMEDTAAWAKAGIMIRESLADNAREAYLVMTPQNGLQWSWRTSTGGSTGATTPNTGTAFTPTWLRIVRSGNTFTAFRSTNGTSWTQIGSPRSVTMGSTVYIGLVTSAVNNIKLNAATYDNVTLTGNLNAGPTLNEFAAPIDVTITSTTSTTVGISWTGIALSGDLNGDGAVNGGDLTIVKANFGSTGAAGSPGDVNGDGIVDIVDYNTVKNNSGLALAGYAIERSSDGLNFSQVGTTALGITSFTDTGLSDGLSYFYRVRARSGTAVSDASMVAGGTTRAGAIANLNIISYTASQLILDWSDASGETSYRLERSNDGLSDWATVTTLGRNVPMYVNGGLAAGAKYYYRVVTIDGAGNSATSSVVSGYTRLAAITGLVFTTKSSNQMAIEWDAVTGATGYKVERSLDGTNWSTVAANQPGLTYLDNSVSPLAEFYYRVTAINANAVGVSATVFAAAPAAVPLPDPWLTQDIGSVGGTGAAGFSAGTFTVVASGADIWGTSDQFRFVYVPFTGNASITAQVAGIENTDFYAKAGLMIRDSLTSGSRNAVIEVTPSEAYFQYRSSTNGGSNSVFGGSFTAPYWLRLTRTSNTITGEISPDGINWTTVGSRSITMSGTNYIGLALTSHNNALLAGATFDNVTSSVTGPVSAVESPSSDEPEALAPGESAARSTVPSINRSSTSITSNPAFSFAAFNAESPKFAIDQPPITRSASTLRQSMSAVQQRRLAAIDDVLAVWYEDRSGRRSKSSLRPASNSGADDALLLTARSHAIATLTAGTLQSGHRL